MAKLHSITDPIEKKKDEFMVATDLKALENANFMHAFHALYYSVAAHNPEHDHLEQLIRVQLKIPFVTYE